VRYMLTSLFLCAALFPAEEEVDTYSVLMAAGALAVVVGVLGILGESDASADRNSYS